MAQAPQTGMEKAEMKQLLNKASPDKPVSFAFGLGKEPAFALLMMHKTKPPKAVDKEMTGAFPDAKNSRWGSVVVEDANPNLAKFIVNKAVSGMAKRLVKTLKGTGYNKVEIVLEDGTVVEGAADEEEEGAAVAGAEAASAAPAPGAVPPAPPPPSPAAPPAQDAGELQRQLAALIPRIGPAAAANPDVLAQLKKFATDATVNIKTNNLTYAAASISQLSIALDKIAPATAGAPPPPPPGPPPAPNAPVQDAGELQRRLAALIPRIGPAAATNPELLAQLKKFATDATVNIKTNNLTYAAASISQLSIALDKAAPGNGAATATPAPAAGAVVYAKSRLAWLAAHQKITVDIEKLRVELVSTYAEEGIAADVEKRYKAVVGPLLDTFNESLADKLDEATNATDPAIRTQLVGEARAIMDSYSAALANPIIADLDSNPFVPLSIQKTLSATLAGLSAAVR